jgi:hypothetical protein
MELRKRINDVASVESNKRKLEVKVEQLEHKVRTMDGRLHMRLTASTDGGHDSRESRTAGKRAEGYI